MLDSSLIQILVVIAFPYIIQGLRAFFAQAPPPSPLQRLNNKHSGNVLPKPSLWNRLTLALLGLTAIYHLFHVLLYNPPNIFKTLSLPADCPNFILRESWQERASLDPTFLQKYPESMRERFKAMENRLMYQVYGQDAFLNCEYCNERSDYMLYLTPGALSSYVAMGAVLGMATTQTSHLNKYRTWGSAALVLLAVFEYGIFQKSADFGSLASFMREDGWFIGFNGAHLVRHGSLAMMSVVVMGLLHRSTRIGAARDEAEILIDLCQAQEAIIQRYRALQLARVAALREPTLRKQFVDYWKKREVEHGLLAADSEYMEARDMALSRIDVETISREADEYINAVISASERMTDVTDVPSGSTDRMNPTKTG